MPMIYRVLFPACASFGPMFMVMGLQARTTFGSVWGGTGALLTSAALFMLFDRTVDGMPAVTPRERRDQVLYWSAVIVIGVIIWLVSEWMAGVP